MSADAKASHTPGPWYAYFERTDSAGGRVPIRAGSEQRDSGLLAVVLQPPSERGMVGQRPTPGQQANARLIAAAPELLQVAEGWLKRCETLMETNPELNFEPEYTFTRATIAKAKARGEVAL